MTSHADLPSFQSCLYPCLYPDAALDLPWFLCLWSLPQLDMNDWLNEWMNEWIHVCCLPTTIFSACIGLWVFGFGIAFGAHFTKEDCFKEMFIIMWCFNVKKYYQRKRKRMKSDCLVLMMDSTYGIIDGAYVFSSSFLRIVSRTSNMPFILVLSLWYVKYFQYHHITAWEAGRSERQKSRNVFHLTKCFFFFLVLDLAHFHLTWSTFALF